MDAARQRERQLKGLNRAKKDVLVTSLNPERRDPSPRIRPIFWKSRRDQRLPLQKVGKIYR